MRVILFDIDGTLLDCGRQVRPLLAAVLEEVYGTAGEIEAYDFAGKCDPGIVLDLMTRAGVTHECVARELPRMRDLYLERLEAGLERERMRLLPQVREVLNRLASQPGVRLGLLTGNWESGARIKLGRFGLNEYFGFGAFGDDGAHRTALPPVALRRAAATHGEDFAAADALIVGDSLLDVECARAHGVPVLAVATGRTSAAALRAAGADWVVDDLAAAADLLPLFAEPAAVATR